MITGDEVRNKGRGLRRVQLKEQTPSPQHESKMPEFEDDLPSKDHPLVSLRRSPIQP